MQDEFLQLPDAADAAAQVAAVDTLMRAVAAAKEARMMGSMETAGPSTLKSE